MPRLTASGARPTARASGGPWPPRRRPRRRGPPRRPPGPAAAPRGPRTPSVALRESRPRDPDPSPPSPFVRLLPESPMSASRPPRRRPRGRRARPASQRRAPQRGPPRPARARPRRPERRTGTSREDRRTADPPDPPSTRPPPGDLVRASLGRPPGGAPAVRPRHRRRASPRHAGLQAAQAADRLRRRGEAVVRRSAPAPVVPSLRRPEGLLDRPPAARSRRRQAWADGARPPDLGRRLAPAVPEGAAALPGPARGAPADTEAPVPEPAATAEVAQVVDWGAARGCRRPPPDEVVRADVAGPRSGGLVVAGATWRSWSRPS